MCVMCVLVCQVCEGGMTVYDGVRDVMGLSVCVCDVCVMGCV